MLTSCLPTTIRPSTTNVSLFEWDAAFHVPNGDVRCSKYMNKRFYSRQRSRRSSVLRALDASGANQLVLQRRKSDVS